MEVSVLVGWKFCVRACVCVHAHVYVCVLDVVPEFICSRQYHIDQRFTYELYSAVKRWRRRGEPLISPFSSFFSTTPNFPPPPEFSLLWTLGDLFEYFVLYKGNTNCGLNTFSFFLIKWKPISVFDDHLKIAIFNQFPFCFNILSLYLAQKGFLSFSRVAVLLDLGLFG